MARISNEERERINQEILKRSKIEFDRVGYEKASTKRIAKEVGIGEGTLFNYYKTKAILFLEVMAEEFKETKIVQEEGLSLDELISDMILQLMKPMMNLPKNVLKELAYASVNVAKKMPNLIKKYVELDMELMKDIEEIFNNMQELGILKACDTKELSEIIYGSVAFELLMYVYEADIQKEEVEKNIKSKVKTCIRGYLL